MNTLFDKLLLHSQSYGFYFDYQSSDVVFNIILVFLFLLSFYFVPLHRKRNLDYDI